MKHKQLLLTTLLLSLSLVACNGGGGGGSGNSNSGGNNGGGGNNNIGEVKKLQVLSPLETNHYQGSCIYSDTMVVTLVNADGSGTGYGLRLSTGEITPKTNLPILTPTDVCLPNMDELTWYNQSAPMVLKEINPNSNINQINTINLADAGLSPEAVASSSFVVDSPTYMFANGPLLGNQEFQFSSLKMNNYVPAGNFEGIDNSLYMRGASSRPFYGFFGAGISFNQFLNADGGSQPSIMIYYLSTSTISGKQTVNAITDANGNAIQQMAAGIDYSVRAGAVVVVAGAIQPQIYNCPAKQTTGNNYNFVCGAPTGQLHEIR